MKKWIYFVLVIVVCVVMSGCNNSRKQALIQGFAMDASYRIKTQKLPDNKKIQIQNYLKTVDSIFDAYQDSSVLGKLNMEKQLNISDEKSRELYQIIYQALPFCNDLFDISIRPVTKLWDFHSENAQLPDKDALGDALSSVDASNIILSENQILLKNDAEIELGAVAKGFVCDKIADMLSGYSAIIDIGGTVKAVGESITVGVKSPEADGILCSIELPGGMAISTSGSYERFMEINGKKYHHILNPATGYPVDSKLSGVSVISDSAFLCDVFSTICFADSTFQAKPITDAIFVTENHEIFLTPGIKNFQLYKNNYTVKSIQME